MNAESRKEKKMKPVENRKSLSPIHHSSLAAGRSHGQAFIIHHSPISGQAMVEFLVGLVAVLVLFAGLLQVASLTKTHTDVMVNARRNAGELAMLDLDPGMDIMSNPDYIRDWQEGADLKRHTRDDIFTSADAIAFDNAIVEKTVEDPSDWEILDQIPNNRLSRLHDTWTPVSFFGLVRGYDKKSVDLIPVVQSLLYKAESIDVEYEVWMTWTKGIY